MRISTLIVTLLILPLLTGAVEVPSPLTGHGSDGHLEPDTGGGVIHDGTPWREMEGGPAITEEVEGSSRQGREGGGGSLLIIVGDLSGDTRLDELATYRESTGIPSTVVDLSDVLSAPTAAGDDPEKVKRYIYDAYIHGGVGYVLLVGDGNDVLGGGHTFPVRYVEATHSDGQSPYPCDLYYADLEDGGGLFSDWDGDGDGRFGEFSQDGMDMVPEVAVGRIPASTAAEVATFVTKVMEYETRTRPAEKWFRRAVLAATDTHPDRAAAPNPGIAESEYMLDKVGDESLPGFELVKFKETDGTLSTADVTAALNRGSGFVLMADHGGQTTKGGATMDWVVKVDYGEGDGPVLTQGDTDRLSNGARLPLWLVSGCRVGMFDNEDGDGFAESLLFNPDGGACGYVASARTSWSTSGRHLTELLAARLISATMRNYRDGGLHVGEMFMNAQGELARLIRPEHYGEWATLAEFNLLGDPVLALGGRGARLSAPEPPPLDPGCERTLTFHASNSGPLGMQARLELKGLPAGWSAEPAGESFTLAPRTTVNVDIDVTVPASAPVGLDPTLRVLLRKAGGDGELLDRLDIPLEVGGWDVLTEYDSGGLSSLWTVVEEESDWHVVPHPEGAGGQVLWFGNDSEGRYDAYKDESAVMSVSTAGPGPLYLEFDTRYSMEDDYDFCYVESSTDTVSWDLLETFTGLSEGWVHQNLSLPGGGPGQIHVRFRFDSDMNEFRKGIFLDNVSLRDSADALFFDDFETGMDLWNAADRHLLSPLLDLAGCTNASLEVTADFDKPRSYLGVWLQAVSPEMERPQMLDAFVGDSDGTQTRRIPLDLLVGGCGRIRFWPVPEGGLAGSGLTVERLVVLTDTRAHDGAIASLDAPPVVDRGEGVTIGVAAENRGTAAAPLTVTLSIRNESLAYSFNGTIRTGVLLRGEQERVEFTWTSPAPPDMTASYSVAALVEADGEQSHGNGVLNTTVAVADILFSDDFEGGGSQVGTPDGDGFNLWTMGSSETGNNTVWRYGNGLQYPNLSDDALMLPVVDLAVCHRAYFRFRVRCLSESFHDPLTLEARVEGAGDWTEVWKRSGTDLSWGPQTVDLSPFAGGALEMRFRFSSDDTVTNRGVFLDDLTVFGHPLFSDISLSTAQNRTLAGPGENATFLVEIHNGGTGEAGVRLGVPGINDTAVSISPPSLKVAPGSGANVEVTVTMMSIPKGEVLALTLEATADPVPEPLNPLSSLPLAIEAGLGVSVTLTADVHTPIPMAPDNLTVVNVTVTNGGNAPDNVSFQCAPIDDAGNIKDADGWTWGYEPGPLPLQAGKSSAVPFWFSPDRSVPAHSGWLWRVQALSETGLASCSLTLPVVVSEVTGWDIVGESSSVIPPGRPVELAFNVTNTGNTWSAPRLSAQCSQPWVVEVDVTADGGVPPLGSTTALVTLEAPKRTLALTRAALNISIDPPDGSGGSGALARLVVDITVGKAHDLTLDRNVVHVSSLPGGAHIFAVTLVNQGNIQESVNISLPGAPPWLRMNSTSVTVEPFGSKLVDLFLDVPDDATAANLSMVVGFSTGNGSGALTLTILLDIGEVTASEEDPSPSKDAGVGVIIAVGAVTGVIAAACVLIALLALRRRRAGKREDGEESPGEGKEAESSTGGEGVKDEMREDEMRDVDGVGRKDGKRDADGVGRKDGEGTVNGDGIEDGIEGEEKKGDGNIMTGRQNTANGDRQAEAGTGPGLPKPVTPAGTRRRKRTIKVGGGPKQPLGGE